MNTLSAISLNEDWDYLFTNAQNVDPHDQSQWIPLPRLSDWVLGSFVKSGVDWFKKDYIVENTGLRLTHVLCIEHLPDETTIFVNGKYVADAPGNRPFSVDVTRFIHEGANSIAMCVKCSSAKGGGMFGSIQLQTHPADAFSNL